MSPKKNNATKSTDNNNQSATNSRHLHFSHATRVHFVPGLWEFSDEEINDTWLTEEDNAKIQVATVKTVKRMRRGKELDDEKYCARGLEHLSSSDQIEQRKINKASVCTAVLMEQKRQRLPGCYDLIKISNQSRLFSKQSRDEALRVGASDAAAAAEIHLNKCHSKTSEMVNEHQDQNASQSITQAVERNSCFPTIDALQVTDSGRTHLELFPPKNILCLSKKCDANSNPTKGIVSTETNVFSRVFSKVSQSLEEESTDSTRNVNRMSLRSFMQRPRVTSS